MTLRDLLKFNDIHTYKQLQKMRNELKTDTKKDEIELGDSVTNLMKANSYKRVRGTIRQTRWE